MEKMFDFFKRILSGSNEAEVRKLMKIVDAIEAQEAKMQALTDAELRGQTALFRERLQKAIRRLVLLSWSYHWSDAFVPSV